MTVVGEASAGRTEHNGTPLNADRSHENGKPDHKKPQVEHYGLKERSRNGSCGRDGHPSSSLSNSSQQRPAAQTTTMNTQEDSDRLLASPSPTDDIAQDDDDDAPYRRPYAPNGGAHSSDRFDDDYYDDTMGDVGATSRRSEDDVPRVKTPRRAYVAIVILFIVNLLNYMDRYTIAGVLIEIKEFFDINDAESGLIQAVFVCSYMVFAPLCGYLGDRYNRKWIMISGLVVWSTAVVGSTFVPGNHFWLFVVCRAMVGVGEASYSTVAPTLIADMFTKELRSYMLMVFYFAIPVGSGLGYVVGANVASALGSWHWGVRITPIFGVGCLLLIVFVLYEPERGEADEEEVGVAPTHLEASTFVADLRHLLRNRTYIWTTLGFASSTFVVGSLALWTPSTVEYSIEMHGIKPNAGSVALIFGGITMVGGLVGVTTGSFWAQKWRKTNPRADPMVCGIGALCSVPFLFCALIVLHDNIVAGWIFVFIVVTLMCLNWAVVVDIVLYVVIPTRRSTATAFQILVSHLLGDAFSPYLVGIVSDLIRGDDDTAAAHFYGLRYALFIPNFVLVFGGFFFLGASWFIQDDRRRAEDAIKHLALGGVKVTDSSADMSSSSPAREASRARLLGDGATDDDEQSPTYAVRL